jgi:hypothetical protein
MTDARPQLYESLRMMYCEHTDQARHHDTLRERSTAVIVALAAALATAAVAYVKLAGHDRPWLALALSLPIVVAGISGMRLARSHSQNNRQHVEIARAFRLILQSVLQRELETENGTQATTADAARVRDPAKVKCAVKWLADRLLKIRKTQRGIECELSRMKQLKESQLKESLSCLLPGKLRLGEYLEIKCGFRTAHPFGEKEWCEAIRKGLDDDDVWRVIGPYDFRTIRDYGQARHNLKSCEGKQSHWSGQIMTGWFWVNLFVVVFGFVLCVLIVFGLLSQNPVDIC